MEYWDKLEEKESRKEESLSDELLDIQYEMLDKIKYSFQQWDSDTIKSEIESIMNQYNRIQSEFDNLDG